MVDKRDCGADAAAYALGALEPAQADAFRRHMTGCAVCQDEMAAFQIAVDTLAMSPRQYRASRRLRRRVMGAVRAEPRAKRSSPPMIGFWPQMRVPRLAAAGALAAVAAIVAGVTIFGATPATRTIQASVHGLAGEARLRLAQGHAELVVSHFSPPPAGHIYEVWLKRPGRPPQPTSALFSVTSDGAGDVVVPGNLRSISAVLVTPEPDGGSLRPTHAPVIVAALARQ
jgi:anti-sigma-K factor RskA